MGQVIFSWQELKAQLTRRPGRERVVFTNGCFDLLHVGHVRYLKEAKAQGDCLVVGLNSDQSVRELKGPTRPLNDEKSRGEILAALECVDFVTVFAERTAEKVIGELRPDIYVKGGDYTLDTMIEAPVVLSYGGIVKVLKFTDGFSTTSIIEKMKHQ